MATTTVRIGSMAEVQTTLDRLVREAGGKLEVGGAKGTSLRPWTAGSWRTWTPERDLEPISAQAAPAPASNEPATEHEQVDLIDHIQLALAEPGCCASRIAAAITRDFVVFRRRLD